MQASGIADKTALVFGQMNESPGVRMRVALSGLTMAEHFRDEAHKDVLLFIDNIFRFVQAGSEVSTLMGRMPSAVGYQPTLANEMGELQERITSTKDGSVTSVQAVYVPADDLTDPATATTFTHLDATTVLSRKIVEQGIYPAVDPLESTSRILEPDIVGEEHYRVARKVQEILQKYRELQDIIARRRSAAPARSSVSSPSPPMWRRSSPVFRASMCRCPRPSRALPPLWTARWISTPRRPSSTWAPSRMCPKKPARSRQVSCNEHLSPAYPGGGEHLL